MYRYNCIHSFESLRAELIVNTVFVTLLVVGLIYFGYQAYKRKGKEGFEDKKN